jgi:hypothetical protein
VSILLQAGPQRFAEHVVVFDQQQAHQSSS